MPAIGDLPEADQSFETPKLAVIAALDVERKCLGGERSDYFVLQSGPGPERAAGAARLAASRGASALMSWGLAGSLAPGLMPGTVLVPARILDSEGSEMPVAPAWRAALNDALSAEFALSGDALVSVDDVLETPEAKSRAALEFGAAACDMESAAIAAVAREAGLPFVALKVIADADGDRLPRQIGHWVDPLGNRRLAPLLSALTDPGEWRPLWVIAMRFRRAHASLTGIARLLSPRSFLCESALTNAA